MCFRNVLLKKFMDKKLGNHVFPLDLFLSPSTKKSIRGTLLCFEKILVMKFFMHRKLGITVLSDFVRLTVPETFDGDL